MRLIITALLFLIGSSAWSAPFLLADPYPTTATQSDSATFTINGGAPQACTLEAATGGIRPKCDLASIASAGTYTLVLTVCKAGGIVNTTGGATNTAGGCASSAPFSYRLQTAAVAGPTLSVSP